MKLKEENVLSKADVKYKNLFEESPISIWEEDFSEVYKYINSYIKMELLTLKNILRITQIKLINVLD